VSVLPVSSSGCFAVSSTTNSLQDRRPFDPYKVVINVGGMHRKDPPPEEEWEKRLKAGRKSFEDEALFLIKQQQNEQALSSLPPVPPTPPSPGIQANRTATDMFPARKVTLQRSRVYPAASSSEVAGVAGVAGATAVGRSKLQYARLKSFIPAPMSEESAEQLQNYQEDGCSDAPAESKALSEVDQSDGSVQSSYHPLDVDLDDDAIMV